MIKLIIKDVNNNDDISFVDTLFLYYNFNKKELTCWHHFLINNQNFDNFLNTINGFIKNNFSNLTPQHVKYL